MNKIQKSLTVFAFTLLVVCFMGTTSVTAEQGSAGGNDAVFNTVADVSVGPRGLTFQPKVEYGALLLTFSNPDGLVSSKTFTSGSTPYLELPGESIDGSYAYELRVIPVGQQAPRVTTAESQGLRPQRAMVQSGAFLVQGGKIVTMGNPEGMVKTNDVLHYDDVIITGSLCVGWDCANGESFGYDTVKLKENNLRLYFEDTSAGSFPSGDWRIRINDTTSGGASYFAVEDGTNGRTPFRIETGAPTHSLYVEDYGRVGLGTSIPYVELHIVDGDSPTIRLDQDGSSGWTAQRWDLCGNETNFFIRDVTNGSKLCFRIQPNTPSSTLCLRSSGYVGIGTWSPEAPLEVETTGENAKFILERTSGAKFKLNVTDTLAQIGSHSNHNVNFVTNNSAKMTIESGGDVGIGTTNPSYLLHLSGGAYCDGGAWMPGSSREYKENIIGLTLEDAADTLMELKPVRFNYKKGEEDYIGFIAEDVPQLVATKERKSVSPMDVVAVLTKVAQEQQKSIREQRETLREQQQTISELKKRISNLEKKY
ncbi:MAG: tail fiber domain-containing protein [bacterium]|nr:tail fiber domain-containing protein [bacterium]